MKIRGEDGSEDSDIEITLGDAGGDGEGSGDEGDEIESNIRAEEAFNNNFLDLVTSYQEKSSLKLLKNLAKGLMFGLRDKILQENSKNN